MPLSYDETREFIDLILRTKKEDARTALHFDLVSTGHSEPEFYDGVIKHGPFMNYTADEWFDFHKKVPHWRLRDEPALMNKLSPQHLELL